MLRKIILSVSVAGSLVLSGAYAQEDKKPAVEEGITLQQLLERVKEGRVRDNSANKRREADFINNRNKQQGMLNRTNASIAKEEARSERLEAAFNENELKLAELEGLLNERLGVFGELFGVVRQVAGETRAQVGDSIISGELTGREPMLDALSKTKGLPTSSSLKVCGTRCNRK